MINDDTIKLLRECNAGIKMGITSIDDVITDVNDHELKRTLEICKKEHEKLGEGKEHRGGRHGENP